MDGACRQDLYYRTLGRAKMLPARPSFQHRYRPLPLGVGHHPCETQGCAATSQYKIRPRTPSPPSSHHHYMLTYRRCSKRVVHVPCCHHSSHARSATRHRGTKAILVTNGVQHCNFPGRPRESFFAFIPCIQLLPCPVHACVPPLSSSMPMGVP